ncbi:MAG: thioredoxin fold domain-containing protein, partial [Bacteroidetes bacterium]|nr:thioredoxin fold domain-containing protein [Bacteroidota bacterium]
MKKIITLIALAIGFSFTAFSQDANNNAAEEIFGKVSYFNGTYENFMESAGKQNKPIMLLFCRPGCHTCSHLKKGLNKKDVGEYFNNYFYSYFIDTEKEKFKLFPLSEKYKVKATPYFVFLTPDGRVLYQGSMNPEKDSVLEKCTQIIIRNSNYQKIAQE